MAEYVIRAPVRSKKNSRQLVLTGTGMRNIPSEAYRVFEEQALWELKSQRPHPETRPYTIRYNFTLKGKARIDIDNAVTAVNDVLQKAGIIGDDADIIKIVAIKTNGNPYTMTRVSINVEEQKRP